MYPPALTAMADHDIPHASGDLEDARAALATAVVDRGLGLARRRRFFRNRLLAGRGFGKVRHPVMVDLIVVALMPRPDMGAESEAGRRFKTPHRDIEVGAAQFPPEQLGAANPAEAPLGIGGGAEPVEIFFTGDPVG